MSRKNEATATALAESLIKWNKKLKVERSAEGDSVIASCKALDVDADDLRKLSDLIDDAGWTITLGRSGANFRMIIW